MPWYNSMYDYYPESDNELEHHGIDNQKWGVRNGPPYPLKPAVSSAVKQGKSREEIRAAKKRSKSLKKARATRAKNLKAKAKEKARAAKEEERKAKQEEKEEKKQAKTKETSSKNPTLMYKNRDLFTTDELKEYADRFAVESRLQEISSKRLEEGKKIVNNILNVAEGGIRGYNMVARLYNTFSDNKDMELPFISGANTGESKNSKGKGNNKGKDK